MKNIVRVALFAVLALSLSACGSFNKPPEDLNKKQVRSELNITRNLNVGVNDITIVDYKDLGSFKCDWPGARIARVRATVRGQQESVSMLVTSWKDDDGKYVTSSISDDVYARLKQ